jgi:hypothetical protein
MEYTVKLLNTDISAVRVKFVKFNVDMVSN